MRSASAVFCIVACTSGDRQAHASSRVSLIRVTVSGSKYTGSLPFCSVTAELCANDFLFRRRGTNLLHSYNSDFSDFLPGIPWQMLVRKGPRSG